MSNEALVVTIRIDPQRSVFNLAPKKVDLISFQVQMIIPTRIISALVMSWGSGGARQMLNKIQSGFIKVILDFFVASLRSEGGKQIENAANGSSDVM